MTDRTTKVVVVMVVVVVMRRDMAALWPSFATAVKQRAKKKAGREVRPFGFVVERMGIEPTTSSMRTMRSPS
jgi:hypothetical protein